MYLLQPSLILAELLQLAAVPDPWQLPPQRGRLSEGHGEARGGRPVLAPGGLWQRQALHAGDGARVGQGLRGLVVKGGWQRRKGPPGGRGRRGGGGSRLPGEGDRVRASLAQDLKVLGGFAVLLVELGSIWRGGEREVKKVQETS